VFASREQFCVLKKASGFVEQYNGWCLELDALKKAFSAIFQGQCVNLVWGHESPLVRGTPVIRMTAEYFPQKTKKPPAV
jgi:hypothetical protein